MDISRNMKYPSNINPVGITITLIGYISRCSKQRYLVKNEEASQAGIEGRHAIHEMRGY